MAGAGVEPMVILNDYRNAEVDAAGFRAFVSEVKSIAGACVCCDASWELLGVLDEYEHPERGVVLVETNGTTDAEEIVMLLASDPKLRRFTLPFQVSVVDAKRWQKRFWNNGLEREQVQTAARLVLGHLDEVERGREAEVRADLAKRFPLLNPVDPPEVVAEILGMVVEGGAGTEREGRSILGRSGGKGHRQHVQKHHFAAMELFLPELVERGKLVEALKKLPLQVLRAKGVVRLKEAPEKLWIFQKIHRSNHVQLLPIEGESVIKKPLAVFVAGSFPEYFAENLIAEIEGEKPESVR